ncbi:MAG: drug/metabolite exporter YedA [Anaerolineae bacterium]|jgi:drug/metabolite transporter (DMT)-like permease|nr:drug/metabolite exporter YedA [Anaerolineae bacterium]
MAASTTQPGTVSVLVSPTAPRLWIILSLLSLYFIWGSTYLAIRIAIVSFPPLLMTGFRFVLAGVIIFAFLRWRGAAMPTRLQARNAALIGVMLLAGGTGVVSFAQKEVDSGLAATAVATVPLWAALFSGIWERFPNRREWVGIGVGLCGIVLLNLSDGLRGSPLGTILLLVAPMSWAFGSMWGRQVTQPSGLMATAFQMLGGGAVLLVVGALMGEQVAPVITTESVLALVYLIVFGALVAFSAYTYLLKHTRPAIATSYAYVNPVVAVLLAAAAGDAELTLEGIAATTIILVGVGLLTLARSKPVPQNS